MNNSKAACLVKPVRVISPLADVDRVIRDVLLGLGTLIPAEASLMAAGLDSITATELSRMVGERLEIELPSTLLFDHPATSSMAQFITGLLRDALPTLDDAPVSMLF